MKESMDEHVGRPGAPDSDRLPQMIPIPGFSTDPSDAVGARDLAERIWAAAERLSVPPKTVLLEEGRVADRLYLIRKGCLRLFFCDDGKEITFQFFFEGDFVASFDSLHTRRPSLFSLESLEPAELSVIGRDEFRALVDRVPALRLAYEEKLVERFRACQLLFLSRIRNTPRQRYEELLAEHPDIVRRVAQHYIASYLGITPVSLSRIRSRR